jgi:hypothetical protein
MSWPALLLWVLVIPATLSKGPALIYLLIVVGVFTSLQMLPGDGTGANLLPPSLYAVALIAKVAVAPGNLMRGLEAALDPTRLGLFSVFMAYCILSALLLPHVFAGQIDVIPVTGADLSGTSPLQPRSGNLTQTCYMLVSYLTAIAFSIIGARADVRHHYMLALLWGAFAIIVSGLLDLVFYRMGLSELLDPFRTAGYTLLTEAEANGVKRVVGLTPEASAYGSLCVNAAAAILFLRPLYAEGRTRSLATVALFGLLVMAVLSTSATAYLGSVVLLCVYLLDTVSRAAGRRATRGGNPSLEIGLLAVVGILGAAVVVLVPGIAAPLLDLIDQVVFQKSASFSYMQRTMWTQVGWQAFLDSGGLGVGLGSVRTSSWPVSVLASTGAIGGALMMGLFMQKLLAAPRGLPPTHAAFARALKLTLFPFLAMSCLGGTIPDIGTAVAAAFGFLSSEVEVQSYKLRSLQTAATRVNGPLSRKNL